MNPVKPAAFRFRPFSRRQKQVLTWWCSTSPVQAADGLIADGSIRSGKTVSLSLSFVLWGMARFNGQNFALCGKTIASLRRNVVGVLKQMLTARGYTAAERRGDNLLIVTRGTVTNYYYLFGGKDEGSQDLIQGITLAGALFDEVALMPESFVNQATARCSVDGSKFWFNCNPEGPEHWFYKSWILQARAKNLLYLHFTMDDNLSLSEPIKARYRAQYTGVFYERYIRRRSGLSLCGSQSGCLPAARADRRDGWPLFCLDRLRHPQPVQHGAVVRAGQPGSAHQGKLLQLPRGPAPAHR